MAFLRKQGYDLVAVVEKWNRFAGVRQDLFGFGDVLAVRVPDSTKALSQGRFLLIQCTSASNHSKRRAKILESDKATTWLNAGGIIEVHSWSKPNKTRRTWKLRREQIERTNDEKNETD